MSEIAVGGAASPQLHFAKPGGEVKPRKLAVRGGGHFFFPFIFIF